MIRKRKQAADDRDERLRAAERGSDEVSEQDERVQRQLGLVDKLTKGWRRVHAENHLARLFRDEGQLG